MGLINQKDIPAQSSVRKESFPVDMGIKYIIIVADDHICPGSCLKGQLIGADLVEAGIFAEEFPAHGPARRQDGIEGLIDPVIMAFGIGTGLRIAVNLLPDTDPVLGSDGHSVEFQASVTKQGQGIFRHQPGNGLGRQIKCPLSQAGSQGLKSGIDG